MNKHFHRPRWRLKNNFSRILALDYLKLWIKQKILKHKHARRVELDILLLIRVGFLFWNRSETKLIVISLVWLGNILSHFWDRLLIRITVCQWYLGTQKSLAFINLTTWSEWQFIILMGFLELKMWISKLIPNIFKKLSFQICLQTVVIT